MLNSGETVRAAERPPVVKRLVWALRRSMWVPPKAAATVLYWRKARRSPGALAIGSADQSAARSQFIII